jgi:lipoprotein-releasing system permease protein
MINTHYLFSELVHRKRRSLINLLLVATALAVMIFIGLLTESLQQAFQAPLADIGASLTVQKSGDVPEVMNGPVLPCSVAPISNDHISRIGAIPGVQAINEAVLIWDFQADSFQIVVGFDPEDTAGPALLRGALANGRFLKTGDTGKAMADLTWSVTHKVKSGHILKIGGQDFEIIGIVDSSQISQIATAQLYIPLDDAKAIASGSASINAVHHFDQDDANLLFIKADRDKTEEIATGIKDIAGKKTVVSTPDSFKEMLGSLFTLTSRFSSLISGMTLVASLLLVARTTAAGVRERTVEIGAMKAIGWTERNIVNQLAAESFMVIALGTLLGICLALLGAWLVSFQSIAIPIPWDMAPTPHFLPGGEEQLSRDVRLTMTSPIKLIGVGAVSAFAIGLTALITAGRAIIRLKPSEVLRNE